MKSTEVSFDYRVSLATELRQRQARNPRYSLRSFARDLGVSVTALSDVLSGKRHFSKRNVGRVSNYLGWTPLQINALLDSTSSASTQQLQLADDEFRVISDWHYLVILNLARMRQAQSSPKWISEQTGIPREQAKEALERLVRLGYISTSNGQLKRLVPEVATTTEIPSAAIRKYHRQNFRLAEQAQEHVGFEHRLISSVTVATDPARFKKAKKMLNECMDKLHALLESDEPSQVVTLSIQMFPARQMIEE
jgi:uncharacterized protein (TIGR02147 family)